MNKKANFNDMLPAIAIILFMAIVYVVISMMMDNVNNQWQTSNSTTVNSKAFFDNSNSRLQKAFDYAFVFLLLGFIIFSVIMARLIPTNPAFFILAIFFILMTWFVSILCSYVWVKFAQAPEFTQVLNNMPYMVYIMPNLLYYALIYTLAVGIAMYTKDN